MGRDDQTRREALFDRSDRGKRPRGAAFNGVDEDLLAVLDDVHGGSAGIVQADDGTLRIGGIHLESIGLSLDESVTWEEFSVFLRFLAQVDRSLPWWIADAAAATEKRYGHTYEELAALTGLKVESLKTYANVSKSIQKSIRIDVLAFGHHQVVQSMQAADQRQFLQIAHERQWSVAVFRGFVDFVQVRGQRDLAAVIEDYERTLVKRTSTIPDRIQAAGENLRIDAEKRLSKNPDMRRAVVQAARAEAERLKAWADELEAIEEE